MRGASLQVGQEMGSASFVLFPLGKKRYALSANLVTELARPDRLQSFPHTTPLLSGVLLRRGKIVPVCDIATVLFGPEAPERKFYLIATSQNSSADEWTAIPVTGECELVSGELLPAEGNAPSYVCGLLSLGQETIEVIDLGKLASSEGAA